MTRVSMPLRLRVRNEEFDGNPTSYARRLASYITDASTIRVNTLRHFGRAPDLSEIKAMMAEVQAARQPVVYRDRYSNDEPSTDPRPWTPRGLVRSAAPEPIFIEPEPISVVLRGPHPVGEKMPVTPREIINALARDYNTTAADMLGHSRFQHIMKARNAAAFVLRQRGNSFPQIGKFLGGRDHSTVINACKRFEDTAKGNDWAIVRRYFRQPDAIATPTESTDNGIA